jgi:hypothetical protein
MDQLSRLRAPVGLGDPSMGSLTLPSVDGFARMRFAQQSGDSSDAGSQAASGRGQRQDPSGTRRDSKPDLTDNTKKFPRKEG